MRIPAVFLSISLVSPLALAGDAAATAVLPPLLPWSGASRDLAVDPADPWATPFERSGLLRTPRYDETVAWLRRLAEASPELRLVSLGKSHEGRDIWMVIASRDRAFNPEALRAKGKPTLFVQAGIHSGEIDGKDAGMMLLRDIAVRKTKADLLDGANLLLVPILNVDGHERFSRFSRINQRGPEEMGWRTNARNLNLNRDYGKLDTPEVRAVVAALDLWRPDLFLDIHVTDGADYQYDVTFGHQGAHALSPAINDWLAGVLEPALARDLEAAGHVPGPLTQLADDKDPRKGIVDWTAGPRYSTGYADARHLPAVLVENHSLKPFDRRVLGTRVLLESALRTLAKHASALRAAVAEDRARRPAEMPLAWKRGEATATLDFKGIDWRLAPSKITGEIEWLGKPVMLQIPRVASVVSISVPPPKAYWIPAAWPEVIDRLGIHGIRVERIAAPREVEVEMYRVGEPKVGPAVVEGHVPITGTYSVERRRERFSPGSARVPFDQPLGELAALLLEPGSPDSFFQWGFFPEVLQPTEYVEGYVMAPTAERMLAADPSLAAEFEKALQADPAFAKDPRARLRWFYRRTPFFDGRHLLVPVAREM